MSKAKPKKPGRAPTKQAATKKVGSKKAPSKKAAAKKPATSAKSKPATSAAKKPATSAKSIPATSATSKPATSANSNRTSAAKKPATSAKSIPATSATSKPATSANSNRTSAAKKPATSAKSKPATSATKRSSTSAKSKPATSPTSASQLAARAWGLALAAPIYARLGAELDALGGTSTRRSRKGDEHAQEMLSGLINASDREELVAAMPLYTDGGTRAIHAERRAWWTSLPREARAVGFWFTDHQEALWRIFIADHAGRPEETSVAAWDAARIVHYAGQGYRAGFLEEHEAWAYVARAAAIAREAYGSWAEYAKGFSYGRWFNTGYWDASMTEAEEAVDQLWADRASPWHALPWDLDLGELAAQADVGAGDLARAAEEARPLTGIAVRASLSCPRCLEPILVRTASGVACDACGECVDERLGSVWATVSEAHEAGGDEAATNLADCIERVYAHAEAPSCARCGAHVDDEMIRAAAPSGAARCECGATIRVEAAAELARARVAGARFFVGGPLSVADKDGHLFMMIEEPA